MKVFNHNDLCGKRIIAFGDSVSAEATIGCAKTYLNLLKDNFKMSYLKNYSIGGTTGTYMFKESNIYKEYWNNETAIDGCRVVKKAVANHEVDNVDFAFIEFGHNDQFFQPPLDSKDNLDNLLSLDNCVSFKASYRYMIRMLKSASPNIKIILLNCTYSEYDKNGDKPYGQKYSYADYRKAIYELANEFDCIYIDPWDYLEPYFHSKEKVKYYIDFIHLSIEGHKLLYDFIVKN